MNDCWDAEPMNNSSVDNWIGDKEEKRRSGENESTREGRDEGWRMKDSDEETKRGIRSLR